MRKRFYVTTAIDYVNSTPHLGTAYEKVTADVIARYKRLAGYETWFLMGNDEHSQNVARRAAAEGVSPLAWCDRMEGAFRERWAALDVSFNDFIRTSQPRHHRAVAALFDAVRRKNPDDIFDGFYEGFYCVGCESFKQEKDLVDGLCPVHKTNPDWIKEKNHFFRLSRYRDRLLDHVEANPSFIQPEVRRNEVRNVLQEGLQDISISRPKKALSWGIPVPFDPESVVWVWFDALTNYVSAVGYGQDEETFRRWWPADLHVVGKDITRFHCIIWPAMLMSAGVELPKTVFGHGWVSFRGERLSKSLGNVVDPLDAVARHGPDPLRLYLVREIPYGGDGDFTWERFEERYNADLANNWGNLVSRVATMAGKFREGRLAVPAGPPSRLEAAARESVAAYVEAMDRFALHEAAAAVFRLIDAANLFLQESAPWALAKDAAKAAELDRVLYDAAEAVRIAAILLLPITPRASAETLRRFGLTAPASEVRLERATFGNAGPLTLSAGDPLFPRLEPGGSKVPKGRGA